MTAPAIRLGPVTIQFDDRVAQRLLGGAVKELPFTLALALNKTGDSINAAGRVLYPQHFHARNPKIVNWIFPFRLAPEQKARKDKLWVTLDTGGAAALLDPFETGKPHGIDRMGRLVAIPSAGVLRSTPMTVIPRSLYPVNLGLAIRRDPKQGVYYYALGRGSIKKQLSPLHAKAGGGHILVGRQNTYQVEGPRGPLIIQRLGKSGSRILWYLRPSVPRPATLEFVKMGTRVASEVWMNHLNNSALWALMHPHKAK